MNPPPVGDYLVTGATGFIGGRMVEMLAMDGQFQVRAMIRDFGRAARLARLPVTNTIGSLTDVESIDRAVKGCDTVFHCAHDWDDPKRNLVGIENLIAACRRWEVRHLVHLSTFAVYHPFPAGELTEDSPSGFGQFSYSDNKLAIENLVLHEARANGFPAVVLQPTIVYGPFGHTWTDRPARQLLKGGIVLPDEGTGVCNAVYVDDLCGAMLLASQRDEGNGNRFLISGPDQVTWREFYEGYATALGVNGPSFLPGEEIEARNLDKPDKRAASPMLDLARRSLSPEMKRRVRRLVGRGGGATARPTRPYLPSAHELALFRATCQVDISAARQVLGYAPRFDFATGVSLTGEYLRWANRPPLAVEESYQS